MYKPALHAQCTKAQIACYEMAIVFAGDTTGDTTGDYLNRFTISTKSLQYLFGEHI